MPEASGKEVPSIRLEVRHLPRALLFGFVSGGRTEETEETLSVAVKERGGNETEKVAGLGL
jgi:hypothetical protein